MYRLDYQTKTIYKYSKKHKAFLFYGKFCQFTKKEIKEMEKQEE